MNRSANVSSDSTIRTTFWLMIALQTIGSVDMPGSGPRKMPSPRSYVSIVLAWGVLSVIADMGHDAGAAAFSKLLLLTGMVIGPFGQRAVSLFIGVASAVSNQAATGPAGPKGLTG